MFFLETGQHPRAPPENNPRDPGGASFAARDQQGMGSLPSLLLHCVGPDSPLAGLLMWEAGPGSAVGCVWWVGAGAS